MDAKELAFIVGGVEVSVADFARALAVQDGCGEEMQIHTASRDIRMQDTRDVLDRAFRYAQQRRQQTKP